MHGKTPTGQCTCGRDGCDSPGKHPRIEWTEFQRRRPTEAEVRQWRKQWPNSNIGVVCGSVSGGLAVLDIDEPALAGRVIEEGLSTRLERTPRGGAHIFLLETQTTSASGPLVKGVADLKGEGGLVVVAPSQGYELIQDGIPLSVPDARRWALDALAVWGVKVDEKTVERPAYKALGEGPIPEGSRNNVLTSSAGSLRRAGLDPTTIEAILQEVNKQRCQPPLNPEEVTTIARSVGQYPSSDGESLSPSDLKTQIHEIRRLPPKEALAFEKRQRIARRVTDHLLRQGKAGTLYLTPEEHPYFFNGVNKTLLGLNTEEFLRFLADLTGLNPIENEFKYLMEHLRTEAHQRGQRTKVFHLVHYEQVSHRVFVTDFGSGMWVLDGQSVTPVPNGEEGILFATSPLVQPFTYLPIDQRPGGATVQSFLEPIHFDLDSGLSSEKSRDLLFIWMLSLFFPELHPTKLIPTFIGPQGSTKTTTARRLGMQLVGERFNVGHLETGERGEQGFIAAVCGKPFAAFDNADAPIRWLPDRLATFATGQYFELRKLYTTNTLSVHSPTAHLVLTSRDPHFRRPDVAERLLLCRLARPEKFVPESSILAQTLEQRDAVWSDLLDRVNQVLVALREVPEAPPLNFRMADFASFGWRVSQAMGGSEAAARFCQSIERLEGEQARYATEEDPVAACLENWLSIGGNLGREIETGDLYNELGLIAKSKGFSLPKSSAAFGKHLHSSRRVLELTSGIKISVTPTSHTSRWVFSKRVPASSENFPNLPLPAQPPQPLDKPPSGGQGVEEGKNRKPS
ncbi:MAG: bifunctional DNA primase/polymerase [Candidatus Omnitrophica bacterium]|nr:bifunctional DNA primase/polymerase [Candidatus Omnitrophota bacterium]